MNPGTQAPEGEELEREIAQMLERETFDPPKEFSERALLNDAAVYEEAAADPEAWWARQADDLDWSERWDTVLDDTDAPF